MKMITKALFLIVFTACLGGIVASCTYNEKVVYDINEDLGTGVIYNENWREYYDETNAYYNNSDGLMNIRLGPGLDYRVIGYIKPGEGGFIENCNFDLKWCYVNFGGMPQSGWVDMNFLKAGNVEYHR